MHAVRRDGACPSAEEWRSVEIPVGISTCSGFTDAEDGNLKQRLTSAAPKLEGQKAVELRKLGNTLRLQTDLGCRVLGKAPRSRRKSNSGTTGFGVLEALGCGDI